MPTVQDTFVVVTARNEAERIHATLVALAAAFPDAPVWVADDCSSDRTGAIARAVGASVVRSERRLGKGGAATLAVRDALSVRDALAPGGEAAGKAWPLAPVGSAPVRAGLRAGEAPAIAILCDGDLGDSAALLAPLADAVRGQRADMAVAAFSRRVGGGFGLALGFARWAIRRRCGLAPPRAPISGQRAVRADALPMLLPFAQGFGMEVGMTIDAVRGGLRVVEVELDLSHRATDRSVAGFSHRARQLTDIARTYFDKR
jgi:hypothetical protein